MQFVVANKQQLQMQLSFAGLHLTFLHYVLFPFVCLLLHVDYFDTLCLQHHHVSSPCPFFEQMTTTMIMNFNFLRFNKLGQEMILEERQDDILTQRFSSIGFNIL